MDLRLHNQRTAGADRIDYLDAAKGFFILLIVTEHHLLGADSLVRYLYSMGVPSFFLITGFLYAHKREWEQPFGTISVQKIRKLLYPYFTFSAINLLWNFLYFKVVFPSSVPEHSLTVMFLYAVTTYGYRAMWYLPCMLWGSLVFLALRKAKHHGWIWAAASVGIVVFHILFDARLTGHGLPSYIYSYLLRIAVAAVFIYAGSVLYFVFQKMRKRQEDLLLLVCTVFSAIIAVLYQLYPEQFPYANLAAHRLGNPYLYYVTAISNTLVVLLLCRKLPGRKRVLSYLGRNSLILMALHMDVTVSIAWYIHAKLQLDFGETVNSLIVIGMELMMFAVIIPLINKYFPFILSPRKR